MINKGAIMPKIEVLDQQTIDKIAAGEVVERPSSVVKELVENAIDAGASAVTVEIKEGGISFIRITDNGCGIEKDQVSLAFMRHSTSKIRDVEDFLTVSSLGFLGFALSSIAAVSQVELITKTFSGLSGVRYVTEGGKEKSLEEIGAPEGTTFLVRNLFYNTPARRKFLKTPHTEAGYIGDLMERLALSHPEISFKLIVNNQPKLHTSGNSSLKEIIYHIYGREIASNLIEIHGENEMISVNGYIGKPLISRGNRNFENYFINGRYIRSSLIARSIEEAYQSFVMQHKYPFTVLQISVKGNLLDVNVHPSKMELRFREGEAIYRFLTDLLRDTINQSELVYQVSLEQEREEKARREQEKQKYLQSGRKGPEPFETKRLEAVKRAIQKDSPYEAKYQNRDTGDSRPEQVQEPVIFPQTQTQETAAAKPPEQVRKAASPFIQKEEQEETTAVLPEQTEEPVAVPSGQEQTEEPAAVPSGQEQTEEPVRARKLLDFSSEKEHRIIGQLFDTYWLVEFDSQLYIIDQHAAHEKVLYERMLASLETRDFTSQAMYPPVLLTLNMQEESLLKKYMGYFQKLGYEIEHFGGKEYAVTALPANLFNLNGKELMIEILDSLAGFQGKETPRMITEKIASMSCKGAVKGNQKLSEEEMRALIGELLTLENPYHCPHGRPTIISMSKHELEKKFKRVL